MNKRKRKKWLKKHHLYVNPKETWNLDYSIAKYVLPRLKLFKKLENGYPGRGEMDTIEKWDAALDKMILAFQYIIEGDDWWIDNPEYDYIKGCHFYDKVSKNGKTRQLMCTEEDWVAIVRKKHDEEDKRRHKCIKEGLELFGKYFRDLWW